MPSFGGASPVPKDKWVLGAIAAVVVSVGAMGWLYLGVTGEEEELSLALDEAVQDSTRFADLIQRTEQLSAQQDSIAARVAVIQEIDEERYVWPHVLDEVARALPDYTWLNQLTQVSAGGNLQFRLTGQAGNNFAVAVFMEQLEASPFIRNVDLITSEQTVAATGDQVVYSFDLEASYVQPPLEFLETVPLFGSDAVSVPPVADTTSG